MRSEGRKRVSRKWMLQQTSNRPWDLRSALTWPFGVITRGLEGHENCFKFEGPTP